MSVPLGWSQLWQQAEAGAGRSQSLAMSVRALSPLEIYRTMYEVENNPYLFHTVIETTDIIKLLPICSGYAKSESSPVFYFSPTRLMILPFNTVLILCQKGTFTL